MTPISLILIIILGSLVLSLPRHHALKPLLIAITLLPAGMVLVVGPLHFYGIRIFVFLGMVRVLLKHEYTGNQINSIDKYFILWTAVMLVNGLLVKRYDQTIITRLGEVYDATGIYFLMRFLIKSEKDIYAVIKALSIIMLVVCLFMIYERTVKFNLFSLLGGSFSSVLIRDGRIRCRGPFAHSILAGTVAASVSSWFLISFCNKKVNVKYAYIGMISSFTIVVLSASSGPIMTLIFAVVAFAFWPMKNNMRAVRYALFASIIVLNFLMKAPLWFLIARIDLTGSSTGWHRAELIDSAIRHFNEWWLIGTPVTRHWMPTGVSWSPYQTDITNMYIKNGIYGGFLGMLLFILIISSGYKLVGKSLKNISGNSLSKKVLIWAFSASLFAHTGTFFSITYFDQSIMYFYLTLAMIGAAGEYFTNTKTELTLNIL